MPRSCICYGCTNISGQKTVHLFPGKKDQELRDKWIKFVKVRRADPFSVTTNTGICEDHFTPDDYKDSPLVIKMKRAAGMTRAG